MAKHLIVGNSVAYGTSGGLVTDGAVSVQKMSSSGPTELVVGDSFIDAPQIRIISGGTDGKDIVTPWIYGRDVINWSGKSYSAPASHKQTVTYAGTTTEASDVVIKLIRIDAADGPAYEFFSFSTAISSGVAAAAVDGLVTTSYAALTSRPDWLETACTDTGSANVFEGSIRGQVATSGNTWDYNPAIFEVVAESLPAGLTATVTAGSTATQNATPGYGDGYAVKAFESELMGTSHGYYNRIELPNAPTNQATTGGNYDMYSIVATKDGSSSSQIQGVDNLIEINLAVEAGHAASAVVENKLNGYFAGVFPALSL